MLDLKMHTFLKVVELKSYTAAAEALHLTQPAVTQHIKKLEEYYSCRLFDFSGRSAQLTEAGRALYHYASLQEANEELLTARIAGISRPVRAGATLSIADYYLPPVISELTVRGIWREISLSVGNTEYLLSQLLHGNLDCAFVEGSFDKELFEARELCQARFLPAARRGHPLSGRKTRLAELHRYPLILREQGSGTRGILEHYLFLKNDSVRAFSSVTEIGSFVVIRRLLSDSDGISFLYEGVAKEDVESGRLCFLDVEDYDVTHSFHFVYLKNSMQKETMEAFCAAAAPAFAAMEGRR